MRHRFTRLKSTNFPEEMMKKRTVITTEKREVWVVRQPSDEVNGQDTATKEAESADSLIALLDHLETDSPPDPYQE